MPNELTPPTPTFRDNATDIAKRIIEEFPGGSTAVGVIAAVFGHPLEKRRLEWCERIASAVMELQARNVPIERLREDSFVDTILPATSVASCTHQQDKLDSLRNPVVNSAC